MPLRGSLWLPFPGSPPQQKNCSLCASGRCFAIARILARETLPSPSKVQSGGDRESSECGRIWGWGAVGGRGVSKCFLQGHYNMNNLNYPIACQHPSRQISQKKKYAPPGTETHPQ